MQRLILAICILILAMLGFWFWIVCVDPIDSNAAKLGYLVDLVEIIAFLSAGLYFIYKLVDGGGLVNLSIALEDHRRADDGKAENGVATACAIIA